MRAGTKKRPVYRIGLTDRRNRRDGRSIEGLGLYNPIATGGEQKLSIDTARVDYWVANGAQTSVRVTRLLKDNAAAA